MIRIPSVVALGLAATAAAAGAAAQIPVLLKDIDARPGTTVNLGSEARPLAVVPGSPSTLYFSAWTEDAGREVWRTQGTAATTTMVADAFPGRRGSEPGAAVLLPNGTVAVALTTPGVGREIHRIVQATDNERIEPIIDLVTGPDGRPELLPRAGSFIGPFMYYLFVKEAAGDDEQVGLARTDGQTTDVVKQFAPGPHFDADLAVLGNEVCVAGYDPANGVELWTSDGTPAGTALVRDVVVGPDGSNPYELTVVGNKLYFSGTFPGLGRELLVYDGNDVALAADVNPQGSSNPRALTSFGGALLFVADDGSSGDELYEVDANGTVSRLADINPGSAGSGPENISVIGSDAFFAADDGSSGRELWKYRAGAPPALVRDFEVGPGSSNPGKVEQAGTTLSLRVGVGGDLQLWASRDGGGSWQQVTTARQGQGGANPRDMIALDNTLVFTGDDDALLDELFVFDPATNTVRAVADVNGPLVTTQTSGAGNTGFTYCNGLTYFGASDGSNGFELWASDGTEAGTRQVADLNPGVTTSQIRDLVTVNSTTVAMIANDFVNTGQELYKYDANAAAFALIKDIRPGRTGSTPNNVAGPFLVLGVTPEVVFFGADDGVNGREPWVSDGTEAGTVMLGDLNPGALGSGPNNWIAVGNGLVVFSATTAANGEELWATDGTPGGTHLVRDILPGGGRGTFMQTAASLDNRVYFGGFFPSMVGVWRTDGLSAQLVVQIRNSSAGIPNAFASFAGRIYFAIDDGVTGTELWSTDGTASGTVQVADLFPGPGSSNPRMLTVASGKLFFIAQRATNDDGLYVISGAGPMRLEIGGERPTILRAFGDLVYFDGGSSTSSSGKELWVSDGTPDGTHPTPEIRRGPMGAQIRDISVAGGQVWVSADDGVHGVEAFVVQSSAPGTEVVGAPCGPDQPTLQSSPPAVGDDLSLSGTSPANYAGVVLVGLPAVGPRVDLLGCPAQIGLIAYLNVHTFVTGAGGPWSVTVPVPDDGGLIHGLLAAWTLFVPLQGGVTQATNAVLLRLGR